MSSEPILVWKTLALASIFVLSFIGGVHFLKPTPKPELSCPQVVRELEQSERLSELRDGWYQEERARAEGYRKLAKELLRARGLPDQIPEQPPPPHTP